MIDNQKILFDILGQLLKNNGYKKKGNTWFYTDINSNMRLVNFQKSAFGNNFYLNFGVYYASLDGKLKNLPNSSNWHFFFRYFDILLFLKSISHSDIKYNIFSFDIPENEFKLNVIKIAENINEFILPFLDNLVNYKYLIKNFPKNFNFDIIFVQKHTLKDLLIFFKNEFKRSYNADQSR